MKVAFTRLMAMFVLAFPLTVLSQAHVSLEFQELESPIVLPDDGWYQIQTIKLAIPVSMRFYVLELRLPVSMVL